MNIITGLRVDAGGGPGSRGGRVIGKTKSGKPIYDTHKHPGHKGMSQKEHNEAGELHKKLARESEDKSKSEHHNPQAGGHFLKALNLKSKRNPPYPGSGYRGG